MFSQAQDRLLRNLNKIFASVGKADINLGQARKNGLNIALAQYQKDVLNRSELLGKEIYEDMRRNYINRYVELTGVIRKPLKRAKEITEIPWSGMTGKQRNAINTLKHVDKVLRSIEQQFRKGGNLLHLELMLRDLFNKFNYKQQRLLETETEHAKRQAELDWLRWLGVAEVKYVYEDDDALCDECRSLGDYNGGIYKIDDAPTLPRHPHCRCRLIRINKTKITK